jgi:hypothetical protein
MIHSNIGFLLATSAAPSFAQEALQAAEMSLALKPEYGYGLTAKACALAALGKFDEAVAWQLKAKADPQWLEDDGLDGGVRMNERITSWKEKRLWKP